MNIVTYPNTNTMPARVLARLLQGEALTHRDFWLVAGTYRMSAPVYELRHKHSWLILDAREVVPTRDRTGRSAHVKRYFLTEEQIGEAGERGQAFVRAVIEWEQQVTKVR